MALKTFFEEIGERYILLSPAVRILTFIGYICLLLFMKQDSSKLTGSWPLASIYHYLQEATIHLGYN